MGDASFGFNVDEVVLAEWGDKLFYAKILTIDSKKNTCKLMFDDKSKEEVHFSQIHSVDETTAEIVCVVCKEGATEDGNEIVLCDACSIGFHQQCHVPSIPASALEFDAPWKCYFCVKRKINPHIEANPFEDKNITDQIEVIRNEKIEVYEPYHVDKSLNSDCVKKKVIDKSQIERIPVRSVHSAYHREEFWKDQTQLNCFRFQPVSTTTAAEKRAASNIVNDNNDPDSKANLIQEVDYKDGISRRNDMKSPHQQIQKPRTDTFHSLSSRPIYVNNGWSGDFQHEEVERHIHRQAYTENEIHITKGNMSIGKEVQRNSFGNEVITNFNTGYNAHIPNQKFKDRSPYEIKTKNKAHDKESRNNDVKYSECKNSETGCYVKIPALPKLRKLERTTEKQNDPYITYSIAHDRVDVMAVAAYRNMSQRNKKLTNRWLKATPEVMERSTVPLQENCKQEEVILNKKDNNQNETNCRDNNEDHYLNIEQQDNVLPESYKNCGESAFKHVKTGATYNRPGSLNVHRGTLSINYKYMNNANTPDAVHCEHSDANGVSSEFQIKDSTTTIKRDYKEQNTHSLDDIDAQKATRLKDNWFETSKNHLNGDKEYDPDASLALIDKDDSGKDYECYSENELVIDVEGEDENDDVFTLDDNQATRINKQSNFFDSTSSSEFRLGFLNHDDVSNKRNSSSSGSPFTVQDHTNMVISSVNTTTSIFTDRNGQKQPRNLEMGHSYHHMGSNESGSFTNGEPQNEAKSRCENEDDESTAANSNKLIVEDLVESPLGIRISKVFSLKRSSQDNSTGTISVVNDSFECNTVLTEHNRKENETYFVQDERQRPAGKVSDDQRNELFTNSEDFNIINVGPDATNKTRTDEIGHLSLDTSYTSKPDHGCCKDEVKLLNRTRKSVSYNTEEDESSVNDDKEEDELKESVHIENSERKQCKDNRTAAHPEYEGNTDKTLNRQQNDTEQQSEKETITSAPVCSEKDSSHQPKATIAKRKQSRETTSPLTFKTAIDRLAFDLPRHNWLVERLVSENKLGIETVDISQHGNGSFEKKSDSKEKRYRKKGKLVKISKQKDTKSRFENSKSKGEDKNKNEEQHVEKETYEHEADGENISNEMNASKRKYPTEEKDSPDSESLALSQENDNDFLPKSAKVRRTTSNDVQPSKEKNEAFNYHPERKDFLSEKEQLLDKTNSLPESKLLSGMKSHDEDSLVLREEKQLAENKSVALPNNDQSANNQADNEFGDGVTSLIDTKKQLPSFDDKEKRPKGAVSKSNSLEQAPESKMCQSPQVVTQNQEKPCLDMMLADEPINTSPMIPKSSQSVQQRCLSQANTSESQRKYETELGPDISKMKSSFFQTSMQKVLQRFHSQLNGTVEEFKDSPQMKEACKEQFGPDVPHAAGTNNMSNGQYRNLSIEELDQAACRTDKKLTSTAHSHSLQSDSTGNSCYNKSDLMSGSFQQADLTQFPLQNRSFSNPPPHSGTSPLSFENHRQQMLTKPCSIGPERTNTITPNFLSTEQSLRNIKNSHEAIKLEGQPTERNKKRKIPAYGDFGHSLDFFGQRSTAWKDCRPDHRNSTGVFPANDVSIPARLTSNMKLSPDYPSPSFPNRRRTFESFPATSGKLFDLGQRPLKALDSTIEPRNSKTVWGFEKPIVHQIASKEQFNNTTPSTILRQNPSTRLHSVHYHHHDHHIHTPCLYHGSPAPDYNATLAAHVDPSLATPPDHKIPNLKTVGRPDLSPAFNVSPKPTAIEHDFHRHKSNLISKKVDEGQIPALHFNNGMNRMLTYPAMHHSYANTEKSAQLGIHQELKHHEIFYGQHRFPRPDVQPNHHFSNDKLPCLQRKQVPGEMFHVKPKPFINMNRESMKLRTDHFNSHIQEDTRTAVINAMAEIRSLSNVNSYEIMNHMRNRDEKRTDFDGNVSSIRTGDIIPKVINCLNAPGHEKHLIKPRITVLEHEGHSVRGERENHIDMPIARNYMDERTYHGREIRTGSEHSQKSFIPSAMHPHSGGIQIDRRPGGIEAFNVRTENAKIISRSPARNSYINEANTVRGNIEMFNNLNREEKITNNNAKIQNVEMPANQSPILGRNVRHSDIHSFEAYHKQQLNEKGQTCNTRSSALLDMAIVDRTTRKIEQPNQNKIATIYASKTSPSAHSSKSPFFTRSTFELNGTSPRDHGHGGVSNRDSQCYGLGTRSDINPPLSENNNLLPHINDVDKGNVMDFFARHPKHASRKDLSTMPNLKKECKPLEKHLYTDNHQKMKNFPTQKEELQQQFLKWRQLNDEREKGKLDGLRGIVDKRMSNSVKEETRKEPSKLQQKCCESCGKDAEFLCSRCRSGWYCSESCQYENWKEHGKICKRVSKCDTMTSTAMRI